MGIPRGYRLVLPTRTTIALAAAALLSVWTALAALAGRVLASDGDGADAGVLRARALSQAVLVSNLWLAVGKSVVFGVLIALIGCHMACAFQRPNTQSLGEGTTASVVTSITVILLVDALFAVVFRTWDCERAAPVSGVAGCRPGGVGHSRRAVDGVPQRQVKTIIHKDLDLRIAARRAGIHR